MNFIMKREDYTKVYESPNFEVVVMLSEGAVLSGSVPGEGGGIGSGAGAGGGTEGDEWG